MSGRTIENIYNTYAFCYDFVFGRIFQPGRLITCEIVNKLAAQDAKILEVGVGTGLSLPHYRSDLNIIGIDISEKMLKKAGEKKVNSNVSLRQMDASKLDFNNNSFDFVIAMYVASVVEDINAFLKEITRTCKPGGDIIIVNHFASNNKLIRSFENKFAKIHDTIGFKSNLSMEPLLKFESWQLFGSYKINMFNYWKLLHFKNL